MSDPDERFASLVCTALVSPTPIRAEAAYLLVTTTEKRAGATMPPVAEALGLDPRPVAFTLRVTGPVAEIDGEVVYLKDAGIMLLACRPVTAEWAALARNDRRVVLVVGYVPMPEDMPVDTYIQQIGQSGRLVVGFVPLGGGADR